MHASDETEKKPPVAIWLLDEWAEVVEYMPIKMGDQDKFARSVQVVFRGLGRLSRERARGGDITPQQAETLQLLAERGALSTSALALQLGIDSSTASRNLSGLERSGYVARKKGADDGRQTDVRLTPRGKRAAESANNKATQAYASVIEKLQRSDRAKVLEALDILARTIDVVEG
jgi:DNA-binding MarR family transcriptional regulator